MAMSNEGMGFKEACNGLRASIKIIAAEVMDEVKSLKGMTDELAGADKGEMIANLMLTYRHLEDASMRVGKAIQAADGGTSTYDQNTVGTK